MAHPDGAECEALSLVTTGTAATAAVDFREGALQEHVFLVIHNVHTCPVHCNNHLVLGQTWSREPASYHTCKKYTSWSFTLTIKASALD